MVFSDLMFCLLFSFSLHFVVSQNAHGPLWFGLNPTFGRLPDASPQMHPLLSSHHPLAHVPLF